MEVIHSRSQNSLSQGHSKTMPELLLYEKGGHGSLSLYLSSRWSGEVYDPYCQLVLRCSTYPGQSSALTLGLCKAHSEHLLHHELKEQQLSTPSSLASPLFLPTNCFLLAPLQN